MDTLAARPPLYILMHPADNVAIVANDGGLDAGTTFESGLTLREKVPQGHKVALVDIPAGGAVRRYNVPIGYAARDIEAGAWVTERLLRMPGARSLENLPVATVKRDVPPPLEGYTFEGYRNPDGSVGTRNILAITQTVQCVAGVTEFAVERIRTELASWRSSTAMAAASPSTRPTPWCPSALCEISRSTRTSAARCWW
jgi:galactarate dehydratase